jgi:hypothetical protein
MSQHGGGRLITVEGTPYRWSVRGERKLGDGKQYRLLSLVGDEATGQVVQVLLRHDDPWVHFSDTAHSGKTPEELELVLRTIKPGLVARVIELVRARGWVASRPGTTLEFVYVDDQRLVPLAEWTPA